MDNEVVTGTQEEMYYRYSTPPNTEKKLILLTTGMVATLGPWGKGLGVVAWCPLPKRNKDIEKELGLI